MGIDFPKISHPLLVNMFWPKQMFVVYLVKICSIISMLDVGIQKSKQSYRRLVKTFGGLRGPQDIHVYHMYCLYMQYLNSRCVKPLFWAL